MATYEPTIVNDAMRVEHADEYDRVCRICLDGTEDESCTNDLIQPCGCSGTLAFTHADCIQAWRSANVDNKNFRVCSVCTQPYRYRAKFDESQCNIHMQSALLFLVLLVVCVVIVPVGVQKKNMVALLLSVASIDSAAMCAISYRIGTNGSSRLTSIAINVANCLFGLLSLQLTTKTNNISPNLYDLETITVISMGAHLSQFSIRRTTLQKSHIGDQVMDILYVFVGSALMLCKH
jgi:hypothetical protein